MDVLLPSTHNTVLSSSSNASRHVALCKLESLIQSLLEDLASSRPLSLPIPTHRSSSNRRGTQPGISTQDGLFTQAPSTQGPAIQTQSTNTTPTQPECITQPQRPKHTVQFPSKPTRPEAATRFTALLAILAQMHRCTMQGLRMTKRDLYYQDVELFRNQATVDRYVEDIAATLSCRREDLGIVAAAKGLILGKVELWIRRDTLNTGAITPIDGDSYEPRNDRDEHVHTEHMYAANPSESSTSQSPRNRRTPSPRPSQSWQLLLRGTSNTSLVPQIPPSTLPASLHWNGLDTVHWVLVVEKEATFRHLAERSFASSPPSGLLITAKGYPDIDTRSFLHRLADAEPCLPIYALTDWDPDGLGIVATYARGSAAMASRVAELNLPGLKWIGVKSKDVAAMASTEGQGLLQLSERDRRIALNMLKRDATTKDQIPWTARSEWREELKRMLMLNLKAEIQILDEGEGLCCWLRGRMEE